MNVMILLSGVIGIALYAAFLGFMLVWVPAPPLIVIVVIVTILLVYDFILALRFGENRNGR